MGLLAIIIIYSHKWNTMSQGIFLTRLLKRDNIWINLWKNIPWIAHSISCVSLITVPNLVLWLYKLLLQVQEVIPYGATSSSCCSSSSCHSKFYIWYQNRKDLKFAVESCSESDLDKDTSAILPISWQPYSESIYRRNYYIHQTLRPSLLHELCI